jgi:hypothetical protein
MEILSKINILPNEIQNLIFYFVIQTEANLIRNIDWKKEYKNTFFKKNISNDRHGSIFRDYLERPNIFGTIIYKDSRNGTIITNKNKTPYISNEKYNSTLRRVGLSNNGFYKYEDLDSLRKQCIDNGITKYNKNNRISMIRKLMKI